MITHRPCGVCRALVSAERGCEHWKPKMSATHWRKRDQRHQDQKHTRLVEDLARVMGQPVPVKKRRPLTDEERKRATDRNRERRHRQRQELDALRARRAEGTG